MVADFDSPTYKMQNRRLSVIDDEYDDFLEETDMFAQNEGTDLDENAVFID